MASRQYNSIVRLFEASGIDPDSLLDISRVKKQLTAEFNFSKSGFIEAGNKHYTKSEVFDELDHPHFFPKRLNFHRQIRNKPYLLDFLEENKIDFPGLRKDFKDLFNNSDFDQFISPYLAAPFANASRNLLNAGNFEGMSELMLYEDFLQQEEREEAFKPLRLFFEEQNRLLRNVSKENYGIMREKLLIWIDGNWSGFFNRMPPEFAEEKTDIAIFLINIGVAVQHGYKKDCRAVSKKLIELNDMPENISSIIHTNHAAYSGSGSSSGGPSVTTIVLVVLIVIKLCLLGGC